MQACARFFACVLLAARLTFSAGSEHIEVPGGTGSCSDDEPPAAAKIVKMNGAELGVAVAKWATADFEETSALFMRVGMLGALANASQEMDALLEAADGQALPALIHSVTRHSCGELVGERRLPGGMLIEAALTALGTVSTHGRKESYARLARSTRLAELGALNATVLAMDSSGLDPTACAQAWGIQQAGTHIIASVCASDNVEALGLPGNVTDAEAMTRLQSEASFRREAAASAGAVETIIRTIAALRDCTDDCGLRDKRAWNLLKVALRALRRIVTGDAGKQRRARAAAEQVIPAIVGALDTAIFRSPEMTPMGLVQLANATKAALMGQDDSEGEVDPAIERAWQDEVGRRPELQTKLQEVADELQTLTS